MKKVRLYKKKLACFIFPSPLALHIFMGVSAKEDGVLKLVHPGRHIEIHTKPVTAAEILKKYPRHCIARPDVFKFPWIVVRPESVLMPGKVFYLIPHRTLYGLLKNKGKRNQSASRENQFPKDHDHHQCRPGQNSQIKCWGGITPKQCQHHQHERRNRRRMQNMHFQDRINSHDQYSEDYHSDTSYVDAWGQVTDRLQKLQVTSYQASTLDSSFDNPEKFYPRRRRSSKLAVVRHEGMQHTRNLETHTELRSCFRKQDSVRKLLNRRVTFGRPIVIPCSPPESASHG